MRISLKPAEIGNVCIMLFFGTLGYIPILMPNTGGANSGHGQTEQVHGIDHVILAVIWAGIFYLLFRSRFHLRLDLFACKVAFFYSSVSLAGALFSRDPIGAMSGSVAIVMSTVYAIYLISKFPIERLVIILGWTILVLALATAAFVVALPAYGLDHFSHGGAWQGVFHQKNSLGFVMTLGVGIGLCMRPANVRGRIFKWAVVFLSLAEVGLSLSREAWVICLLVVMLDFLVKLLNRFQKKSRVAIILISLLVAFPIVSVVATNWTEILTSLGRDATLTGRVPLWGAVLQVCRLHPWVGLHGEGFWGTPEAERVYAIVHWSPTSAHNGFIECLLIMGIAGLLPLIVLFGIAFRGGYKVITTMDDFEASRLWIYSVMVIFSFNLIQTTTGQANSIGWVMLVASACMLDANSSARVPAAAYAYRPREMTTKVGSLVRL
jgi:exopolysaccharide production protein ExoQ